MLHFGRDESRPYTMAWGVHVSRMMSRDAHMPKRRSVRLPSFDYRRPGSYFITICTRQREPWFGKVIDGEMVPNEIGTVVVAEWNDLPEKFPGISVDEFQVMPDHVHGLINIITIVGARFIAPALGNIVRTFKAVTTRRIRVTGLREFAWQRNYYEHVIRNSWEYERIRQYVQDNPRRWGKSRFGVMPDEAG